MRFRLLVPLMVLFLALTGWVQAQQATGDILFETDFEASTIPAEIQVNGNWELVTESGESFLRGTGVDWNDFLFFETGVDWTNYILEVDVRMVAGRSYFDVRSPDTGCSGYELVIAPDVSELLLLTLGDAEDTCETLSTLDTVENFTFTLDTWTPVRLHVNENQLTISINDKEVMTAQDTTYSAGAVKVFVAPDGIVDLDNIRITSLDSATAAGTGGSTGGRENSSGDQPTPTAPSGSLGGSLGGSNPTNVTQLENYAGTHQEAIAELEKLGLVPAGGTLLFVEDYAWFNGSGNWFTPLARYSPHTDIIMAGEITFNPGGEEELELCTLTSRIVMNNSNMAINYLDVGFVNDGTVVLLDISEPGGGMGALEVADLQLDYSQSHHLLYTAIGDRASVFIDGELVFDNIEVVEREGTFGIALVGTTRDSRCEGRNIWVYNY